MTPIKLPNHPPSPPPPYSATTTTTTPDRPCEKPYPNPNVTVLPDGRKIHEIREHKFLAVPLLQPTYCSLCKKFIYGIGKQGYECQGCKAVCHKHCHQTMYYTCRNPEGVKSRSPSKD